MLLAEWRSAGVRHPLLGNENVSAILSAPSDYRRSARHHVWHALLRHPSKRAGRNRRARIRANTAPTVMPISRNGKESNHTTGKRTSASSATGQHSTNRMHHPTNSISAFTGISFHFHAGRQLPSHAAAHASTSEGRPFVTFDHPVTTPNQAGFLRTVNSGTTPVATPRRGPGSGLSCSPSCHQRRRLHHLPTHRIPPQQSRGFVSPADGGCTQARRTAGWAMPTCGRRTSGRFVTTRVPEVPTSPAVTEGREVISPAIILDGNSQLGFHEVMMTEEHGPIHRACPRVRSFVS